MSSWETIGWHHLIERAWAEGCNGWVHLTECGYPLASAEIWISTASRLWQRLKLQALLSSGRRGLGRTFPYRQVIQQLRSGACRITALKISFIWCLSQTSYTTSALAPASSLPELKVKQFCRFEMITVWQYALQSTMYAFCEKDIFESFGK